MGVVGGEGHAISIIATGQDFSPARVTSMSQPCLATAAAAVRV